MALQYCNLFKRVLCAMNQSRRFPVAQAVQADGFPLLSLANPLYSSSPF